VALAELTTHTQAEAHEVDTYQYAPGARPLQ
jgi:hypothetical protein